jgi:hypothetical protein
MWKTADWNNTKTSEFYGFVNDESLFLCRFVDHYGNDREIIG